MTPGFLKRLFAGKVPMPRRCGVSKRGRTILLVSALQSECDTVRVFSLLNGWHLLIARDVRSAIELRDRQDITIILYDDGVAGISWREGIKTLLEPNRAAPLILLSFASDEARRAEVLALGGYDTALKPLGLDHLAQLVNSCCMLMNDVDAAAADHSPYGSPKTFNNKSVGPIQFGTVQRR